MEKDAKIYVAGHNGMVGSAIRRALLKAGYLNILQKSHKSLDLTNQNRVKTFFETERPQYVFVAAARVGGILANSSFPAEFIYQNLMIQNNIIHYAHKTGVKKLLFLGSSCIYPRNCPQPMLEEHLLTGKLEPTNEAYSIAKIAGIKMCHSYYQQYGDNFFSVMPTNLYGINDNFDLQSSHVLPALLRKFHEAKIQWDHAEASMRDTISVKIWGSGKPYREFLHVDDMAEACLFIMKNVQATELYAKDINHLNIGSGKEISIAALAEIVKEVVGFKGTIQFDPAKPDGTLRKLLNIDRAKALGWRPRIGLKAGITRTYQWYQAEGIK